MDQEEKQEEKRMNQEEVKKAIDMLRGSDAFTEMEEEQEVGLRALVAVNEELSQTVLVDWLYSKEWEDVLIPARLPKGMSEMLKMMDETRAEVATSERCKECKTKDNCSLILRNPSEILITVAIKLAFAKANVTKSELHSKGHP